MTLPVASAWVLMLAVFGQPIGAAWCALECQHRDAEHQQSESHCPPPGKEDEPASSRITGENVAFCNHDVGVIATTSHRQQVFGVAATSVATVPVPAIAPLPTTRVVHHQGPPGLSAAPLPLRL